MFRALPLELRCWSIQNQCSRWIKTQRTLQTSAKASASTPTEPPNSFPYPTHRNPTPHQLFHLPHNASESDIKARYYDLVRLYHPDKVGVSTSPEIAHARFQAITAAYNILRGKNTSNSDSLGTGSSASAVQRYQTTAAYRSMRRKRQELYDSGAMDDSRKDRFIIFGVVVTILAVMVQTTSVRREALSESLSRHRQAVQNMRPSGRDEERLSIDQHDKSAT